MHILLENVISFHDVTQILPRNREGNCINFSTIWRWAMKGIRGPDGRRVKLECVRVGRRWVTSREALDRLATALTPVTDETTSTPPRTPIARQTAARNAAKKLKELGI